MSKGQSLGNQRSPRVSHIGTERGAKMTDAAIEISNTCGVVISGSAVVKYLIDNFTDEAKISMINMLKSRAKGG